MEENKFKFEFDLQVLNHLGRGLYRNFVTVVAEAISNCWDAEAENVHITIDHNNKKMIIRDDGKGMNTKDFQNKFLKIGYSRRKDIENSSKRKVLGRKGIGKLAMLSISEKVTISSKKNNSEQLGGLIDNGKLDKDIEQKKEYFLQDISSSEPEMNIVTHGTCIKFEGIKDSVNNPEIIKKHLATLFNFSLSNPKEIFNIFVNDEKVNQEHLKELSESTEFLWLFGKNKTFNMNIQERFLKTLKEEKSLDSKIFKVDNKKYEISGYVASVETPKGLKIHGSFGSFKAGLHLFVNGRLRQENIFLDIPSLRLVESYLYGEIHVDGFDDGDDIFTSSREGVIKDTDIYQNFLEKLKEIQTIILKNWDEFRIKHKEDGDPGSGTMSKSTRKTQESFNAKTKEFSEKFSDQNKETVRNILNELSTRNMEVYQNIFILENLIRNFLAKCPLKREDNYEKMREQFEVAQKGHNLENNIRVNPDNLLNYAGLPDLFKELQLICEPKEEHKNSYTEKSRYIKPIRDSVMHTAQITQKVIDSSFISEVIELIERSLNKNLFK